MKDKYSTNTKIFFDPFQFMIKWFFPHFNIIHSKLKIMIENVSPNILDEIKSKLLKMKKKRKERKEKCYTYLIFFQHYKH